MHSLHSLLWRNLTAHPLRSALTALAIALGVSMVLAAAVVGQAASQSATAISEGPRTDLQIFARDDGPFPQAVLDLLRASPKVERVSPSLRVEAEGIRPAIPRLKLLGVDPEAYRALHKAELATGDFLPGPDTIVLPAAVALQNNLQAGDKITLRSGDRVATLVVAGRLATGQDGILPYDEALVPLGTAQALAGATGQIDRVQVALRSGANVEQARAELAGVAGDDLAVVRAVVARGVMGNVLIVQAGLVVVGLIILFAASFVIFNAFATSITGRMREIGALRALGMTRRQVMRTVLAEASVLGLIGTVAGVLIGLGLAWAVMRAMHTLEDRPLVLPWWSLPLSALMGLATTWIAALQPAWRASRVSPIVAARPEATAATGWYVRSGGRVGAAILGLLLPGLAAYGLLARPDVFAAQAVMGVGQAALLGATVLLLPALVDPMTALCRPLLTRWLGIEGQLAADNLGRNRLRTALTAGALTAGLTIVVATSGLMTAGLKGSLSRVGSMLHEDSFVVADVAAMVASGELSVENFFQVLSKSPTLGLSPVAAALDPLVASGVIEVERNRFAPIPAPLTAIPGAPGIFVDPEIFVRIDNFEFFEGDPETALEWMERGRAMLLPPLVAERLGVRVGDDVPVQTPHGEVAFTVAGIGGSGWLMTVFCYADGETYFDVTTPTHLGIVVAEGQDVKAALAQVREAIEPFPEITLHDYDNSFDPLLEMVDRLEWLLDALLLLAIVVAALGVINTMVINVAERRREIGLLRAVGATQRQVRRAVVAEAATLGLLAALVAGGLGLLLLLSWGLLVLPNGTTSVGVRPDWETIRLTVGAGLRDVGIAAAFSLILGPLVAGLAAYYPARAAAAMDVVEATRSDRVTLKQKRSRRPESRRRQTRSLTWTLALRHLGQSRMRTALSALAVALGVAMTVAADAVSASILNALSESEDAQTFMTGLLDQLGSALTMVGVGITLTAGFLVFNAFAMSITQRRRQIGALRSLGMTRRQVMRLVLAEASITGGLGTLLGLVAGPLLGRGVIALIKILLGEGMFAFAESGVSPASLLLAAALGVGVTWLSVLIPAWQAARISPLVALREEMTPGVEPIPFARARVGTLTAVVLAVYLAVAPPGEWVRPPQDTLLTGLFVLLWLGCLASILPALIGLVGGRGRGLLTRLAKATGRLIADNVQRGRRRVTLTALTLAAGLAMIVGTTGLINFFGELMLPQIKGSTQQGAWMIGSADFAAGMSAYRGMDKLTLSPETVAQVHQTVEGRASTVEWHFAIVPELSFFGDSYFSFVMHPREVRASGEWTFAFTEGDWETARPIMEKGCGVLISPLVASRNGVSLGETFEVTGRDGPVECTVAGIGSPYVGASIVSAAAIESFGVTGPIVLLVSPLPGADRDALAADLAALSERRPDVVLGELKDMARLQTQVTDALPTMLNALLLLAILAAALGVVNTTMISVAERRRELGLLRAVGATRRQVIAVVAGEAALMGLVGGGLGLVAGAGTTVILAVTYGGNAWGAPDLALWPAAWRSVGPALLNGLAGLVAAPFICAGAAWLPARAVETLQTDRQQPTFPRRVVGGLLNRGSIRTRFVLGTGLLTFIVLAGLIGGVIAHARAYMEDQLHGALSTMITASASAIELGLPGDAEALTGATFETGPFDVTAMLRLQALMADLSANGLADLTVANRDNVVLFNLDPRRVGTILPPLEASDHTQVHTRRAEGERQMVATAPIRAKDGRVLGSVRMTVHLNEARAFLDRLRNTLWAIGSLVLLGGLALSWTLSTPLVVATQQLAAHAARVGRGDYTPFSRRRRRWPGHKTSLRTRLTVALALMLAVMVGVLEGVTIPIERQHVERALLKSLATATEWMGQVASETIVAELPLDRPLTLDAALQMGQAFDLAKLQELGEQMRNENLAYLALVGRDGTIQASDQLSLVGQTTSLPAETQIEEARWHDEEIWVASTPLRHGRAGEPVGALQLGVRHAAIETFLDESRSLFRLTGLIAVLAGVLLAQAIGGVATAPVRHLVAGVRQVTQGDLDVQFKVDSRDELALLAGAFNQMVAGLREREWLRDTFGRFVSREVAEAIRTGQVRLEGENRVVSVLFCDIRGFTTRSEQSTPAQIVALLNEYLPVVIEAAQRHEGTVNKFGGDSTLIVYGAPRRLQESAYRAVLTALEVRANLKILNARLVERGQAPLRIGVGINTGMALAGAVGPKERQEYTVIGDTVNLASRIEALNKTYPEHDILISGRTYEALGRRQGEFEFADLGRVSIRGKVEAVQVWGVVGFKVLHARSLRHV